MSSSPIVLIHGLFMNNLVMQYLNAALTKKGYEVSCFEHKSRHFSEQTLQALHNHIRQRHATPVNLVGHSMGGLIARQYFQYHPEDVSNIVTLGTPHNRSILGHMLKPTGILGSAGDSGIVDKLPPWEGKIPLGSIAGSMKLGLLGFVPVPSDGTVLEVETQDDQFTDHTTLHVSHTGLVYSKQAVHQIDHFLRYHIFDKDLSA